MAATKYEVVLIATPGIGNLVPLVEFAQCLVDHDCRLSATVLNITMPERPLVNTYVQSRAAPSATNAVRFLHLPAVEDLPSLGQFETAIAFVCCLIEKHKPQVKQAIAKLMTTESDSNSPTRLAGLFVDMFCTPMIDVAEELKIPCYLYFSSPATFLSFMLHLPVLDTQITAELAELDTELTIPAFANAVPPTMLPPSLLKKDGYSSFLANGRRYSETKGMIVNTFRELEPYALDSVAMTRVPRVFPVGPILDLAGPSKWHPEGAHSDSIMTWLDHQPTSSVVFLCFGSMGSLSGPQLREIAFGLERVGCRFLWAMRQRPKAQLNLPSDYTNLEEILPDGFLERTAEIGLVCGWVPQVTILAHRAIGGFVSHCGWNSILESLWHGVPIATWPIYAEQQLNAFEMVKELGLAVEITLDYKEGSALVVAEEVERGIRRLMDGDDEVRGKVKEMSRKSRMAVMENGSSYGSMKALIEELVAN